MTFWAEDQNRTIVIVQQLIKEIWKFKSVNYKIYLELRISLCERSEDNLNRRLQF